jgi:hypothetical protein
MRVVKHPGDNHKRTNPYDFTGLPWSIPGPSWPQLEIEATVNSGIASELSLWLASI